MYQASLCKNVTLRNHLVGMPVDSQIKKLLAEEIEKKINSNNWVMNMEKGITRDISVLDRSLLYMSSLVV